MMTENEKILIDMVRENDNPMEALIKATGIVISFLMQHGSSEEQAVVYPQEPA